MMMMQSSETPEQKKNSLLNAMNRFIGAVNNMDQTISVPSLSRDVPSEEDREMGVLKSDSDEGDMYSYYELSKSIRSDMEWGVRCASADERHKESMKITRKHSSASTCSSTSSSSASCSEEEDEGEDEDSKKQFQFHSTGSQGVSSKSTQQANSLTKRYKQELGIGGWGQ